MQRIHVFPQSMILYCCEMKKITKTTNPARAISCPFPVFPDPVL
jgi:hypothetical protein